MRNLSLGLTLLIVAGCSTKTTVQVARHPLIEFTYDSLLWSETKYTFLQPYQVVSYPANGSVTGLLYTRYTMQATGHDTKGQTLQFNVFFDVSDPNQLVGTYRPSYTVAGGLAQVQLFNLDNNNLSDYELSPSDTTPVFQIIRQDVTERLIAGSFAMTLFNARDSTQKIQISNGILTDISYYTQP